MSSRRILCQQDQYAYASDRLGAGAAARQQLIRSSCQEITRSSTSAQYQSKKRIPLQARSFRFHNSFNIARCQNPLVIGRTSDICPGCA